MAKSPLEGIRVVNFGWVWAGPVVGQTLSFLGAEVYKIESNARIDLTRSMDIGGTGAPPAFYAGQGSVTLNMKSEGGRELIKRLVAESDIVVNNFGCGALDRVGLGYDELRKVKEDIIVMAMPTAGNDGPLKDVRTYGMTLASICGFDSFTGYEGEGPSVFETPWADPYNGILACFGLIAALNYRNRTGKGQFIDYSQQEAVQQLMGPAMMNYFMNGENQPQMGNTTPFTQAAPHCVYPCLGEDNWISIACFTEDEWQGLVNSMGNPEWAGDAAFATIENRVKNQHRLNDLVSMWTRDQEKDEATALLQANGVAAAPARQLMELKNDPWVRDHRLLAELAYPNATVPGYGHYVRYSESEQKFRIPPMLGEDNDKVFKEILGMSDAEYTDAQAKEYIY